MRTFSIAVRSLCEFTARSGDLHSRFTPAPSAQQGIAGHGIVAGRRGPSYQREVPLRGQFKSLAVRGRADGYDAAINRLEEFKTHRGALERMPANQRALHWAQLKMYGAMLCADRALESLELTLVYFDIKSETETLVTERFTAPQLAAEFEWRCEAFIAWADQELEHRERRDRLLGSLRFPHESLRAGQRQMAEAVYRAARGGRPLMVEAPTGIGKTIGTLFPLLKAAQPLALDKVLFLTAKTPGRRLALDAMRQLAEPGEPALRVLELVSKENACLYPGRTCDGASCPLAQGFYDRLPQARAAAVAHAWLDQASVQGLAAATSVCPYYLTQEMARWCDVIVGDYNHYFDHGALLHGLTLQNQWRIGVLVDEAHNLVGRAREMYSATLDPAALAAALPSASVSVRAQLNTIQRVWRALCDDHAADYAALATIPAALSVQLQRFSTLLSDELAGETPVDGPLLRFHFDVFKFSRLTESFGEHSLIDLTRAVEGATLCIRNVNPAPFLAPRFAAGCTTILFSATLSPAGYYRRLLGVPDDTRWIDVESPYSHSQLEVRVARGISTRFRDRAASLKPIAELIARQYRAQPGNYLAFFSSFEYLGATLAVFRSRFPDVIAWEQVRHMDAAAKDAFLGAFTAQSRGVGFAVLGGVFAEGIDLPGDRLIGAFITTLGLPCVNGVNAQIEQRMQRLFDAGYEYTYLYPGLQKVVQAAGRVIRTASDRGVVHLIDDRYGGARVRELLPKWWRIQCS